MCDDKSLLQFRSTNTSTCNIAKDHHAEIPRKRDDFANTEWIRAWVQHWNKAKMAFSEACTGTFTRLFMYTTYTHSVHSMQTVCTNTSVLSMDKIWAFAPQYDSIGVYLGLNTSAEATISSSWGDIAVLSMWWLLPTRPRNCSAWQLQPSYKIYSKDTGRSRTLGKCEGWTVQRLCTACD